jgi:7-cyano-7-deazaguanine synthase in queuosine biosynthesis
MNGDPAGRGYTFGVDYTRDDDGLVSNDGVLEPMVEDLLDLVTTAYLTDRSRHRGQPLTDEWRRSLPLTFCPRLPQLWQSRSIVEALLELMTWLTEDDWSINIASGPATSSARQMALPWDHVDREVALFSGGLDATAGTALLLQSGQPVLGVAVQTNSAMRGYQASVARALRASGVGDLRTTPVFLARRNAPSREEPSRRTRGLVFLACGWAAAQAVDRQRLLIFENGVGAINLPYTRAQDGCMTSRAVHPKTLRLASRLFSTIANEEFTIVNPHLHETKGEMCARLPASVRPAVGSSQSCDNSAAGRSALGRRCGRCASCLLRRVSLHAAGRLSWDPALYQADQEGDGELSRVPEMLWQTARLDRALRVSGNVDLALEFPELAHIDAEDLSVESMHRLYRTYVEQWRHYPHPRVRAFLPDSEMAA